jgi:hypothetical protein
MPPATPPQPVPEGDTVLCPRCSGGFQCGVDSGGCWCAGVVLDDVVRKDLSAFYKGCLCPACLQSIEDTRPPRPSVRAFLKKNLRRASD